MARREGLGDVAVQAEAGVVDDDNALFRRGGGDSVPVGCPRADAGTGERRRRQTAENRAAIKRHAPVPPKWESLYVSIIP